MRYFIYDNGLPYVPKEYATRELATEALDDLLAPYPPGDEWRQRLHVMARVSALPKIERKAESSEAKAVSRRAKRETR